MLESTDPRSAIAVLLSNRIWCQDSPKPGLFVTESLSFQAPLTDHTKARIVCNAINNESLATGVIQGTVQHFFTPTCWLESGLTLGHRYHSLAIIIVDSSNTTCFDLFRPFAGEG